MRYARHGSQAFHGGTVHFFLALPSTLDMKIATAITHLCSQLRLAPHTAQSTNFCRRNQNNRYLCSGLAYLPLFRVDTNKDTL